MHELHRHEINGRNCNRDIGVKLMGNWSIITSGSSLEREYQLWELKAEFVFLP